MVKYLASVKRKDHTDLRKAAEKDDKSIGDSRNRMRRLMHSHVWQWDDWPSPEESSLQRSPLGNMTVTWTRTIDAGAPLGRFTRS
jgi:hypothetical protein